MALKGSIDERVLGVLRASGVFGRLADNVLRDLCALLELHFVPGGKIVYREGDLATNMFFLVSGRLRVSRRASPSRRARSRSTNSRK